MLPALLISPEGPSTLHGRTRISNSFLGIGSIGPKILAMRVPKMETTWTLQESRRSLGLGCWAA